MNAIPMEVTDDRKTTIVIEGEQYDLVFNARATKEICLKYGSVEEFLKIVDEATQAETVNYNVWLTTLFINQGIAIYNRHNPDNQRAPFTEDDIDLLTSPADWESARNALIKGARRDIKSEAEPSKNAEVG